MRRLGVALGIVLVALVAAWALMRGPRALHTVGPLQVSNRTATPLSLWGHRLPRGARVVISKPDGDELSIEAVREDGEHLAAVLPPIALPPDTVRARMKVRVVGEDGRTLAGEGTVDVVNDAAFRDPIAMAVDGAGQVAVVSPNTDELWIDGRPQRVGDGPRAVTTWQHDGASWWVVTLELEGALRLIDTRTPTVTRTLAVGLRPQRAVVDAARGVAYVSDRALDQVLVLDLADGAVRRRIDVDPQPDVMALGDGGRTLWVSSGGTETIAAVDLTVATSTPAVVSMGPGATIIGGPTEPHAAHVMGGKPARAMVAVDALGVVFATTLGPNLGPNAERMAVSLAGGVSVIDARTRRFLRHRTLERGGVAQDLAWDAATQRLYVTDSATGRVLVLDGAALAASDEGARKAWLGSTELSVAEDVPRIRPVEELAPAQPERAADSLHAGPWAIALHGGRAIVLQRFARTVDALDPATWALLSRTRVDDRPETQALRRRGQIVYFTDVGQTWTTCDACHPEGADGGMLFTKGQPMQIHRSPSIRSAHDSAPFFTPARLASLAITGRVVLARNRIGDPPVTPGEVSWLAEMTRAFSAPPSPFRPRAELPDQLALPDGRVGHPRAGRVVFEDPEVGCSSASCHPPPHFTADQASETRGQFHDVGTPRQLRLRIDLQDNAPAKLPAPSLLGIWDNHPLLFSGAAGFSVAPSDDRITPDTRFALGRALQLHQHAPLSAQAEADLLAYLLTL